LVTKARKAATAVAFGASLFVTGQAEAGKAQHPPPQKPTQEELDDREDMRRDAIRRALLEQAQRDYPSLIANVQTGYSAYLQGLQERVNRDLRTEGNRLHNQTVILDPAKFDTGMAIGLNSAAAVEAQLRAQGGSASPEIVKEAGEKMATGFMTKFGPMTYTQDPSAFTNIGVTSQLQACVIVPSSDHAFTSEMEIPGLSARDRITFLDRHETWHCRDDRYTAKGINAAEVEKVDKTNLAAIAASPEACKVIAMKYQKESFADVGGIGSMLREGHDLSLLDNVAAWRKNRSGDALHISVPVLEGMKKEIAAMGGINKFRALNEDQAKNFYYQVVDKYGVTGPAVQTAVKYQLSEDGQRLGYQIASLFDRDTSRGIDYFRDMSRQQVLVPETPLSPEQTAALDRYNPRAQLELRAYDIGKKITPTTMIQAYTQLQEELRGRMKEHPGDALYTQEMIKLQKEFTQSVKTMDYVEANRRVGVKIENVEPALAAFSDHPPKKGAPRTSRPTVKPGATS
jgi:hypothetical protein